MTIAEYSEKVEVMFKNTDTTDFWWWDLKIKKYVPLNAVQIININCTSTEYEAITFDFPKNLENCYIIVESKILQEKREYEPDIVEIGDTFIRFKLSRSLDPDIYDFILYYYD